MTTRFIVALDLGLFGKGKFGISQGSGLLALALVLMVPTLSRGQVPPRVWSNASPILIADTSTATPYPSLIDVEGLQGKISKIIVTLHSFTHTFPPDVGVLLVGPSGQRIVLMNGGSGGGMSVSNLTLAFDQSASAPIPLMSGLTNGSFRPADYSLPGQRIFASPAPSAPYTNTLDAFVGGSPNGTWSLYVQDFQSGDSGMISNGWSLAVYTEPVIKGLDHGAVGTGMTPLILPFTIGDDSPWLPAYSFTATSDNPSVVTNGGIVFSGSGTNWVLTLNPVPGASGTTQVRVTLVNQEGQEVSTTLTVIFFCDFPSVQIQPVPDQTIYAGSAALIPLVCDYWCSSPSQVSFTAEALNTNLVPVGNLKLLGTNLLIWPIGNLTGTTPIRVTANTFGFPSEVVFRLNVVPSPPVFANTTPILIKDNQPAVLYPSTIEVSGLASRLSKLSVAMLGFSHGFPQDVSGLLVGPQGQTVVLMSRAGGAALMTNTWLGFDDDVSSILPQFTLIFDGTYRPTDYRVSDRFFVPAPPAPYSKSLSVFDGTDPNGTWSLYVQDDQAGDSGLISGGWILKIDTTHLTTSPIASQTTMENTDLSVAFTVASATTSPSNIVVSALSTNENPPELIGNLNVTGDGTQRTLVISPAANLPSAVTNVDGTCTIVLTEMDGQNTNTTSFPLTVRYVNQPPTICCLSNQTTSVNRPLWLDFAVNDVDTSLSNLVVSASVSDNSLGTAVVTGNAGARTLTYTPSGYVGQNMVCVMVSDGLSLVTNCFALALVTDYPMPMISPIADVTTNRAATVLNLAMAFTVDGMGPAGSTNVQVVALSDNTNLVTQAAVFPNGDNAYVVLMTIPPNLSGTATITVLARGEYGLAQRTFKLTVLPSTLHPGLGINRASDVLKIICRGGPPGVVCVLESTRDLENWAGVTNVTADATGFAEFSVQVGEGPTTQFYRVRVGQ